MKIYINYFTKILFLSLIAAFLFQNWRYDTLLVTDQTKTVLSASVTTGEILTTEYIHSVEKTKVEDRYKILNGEIWGWEEKVRSSNAGMPSVLLPTMHFSFNGDEMIFRGGRQHWKEYNYRIGNSKLGHNAMKLRSLKPIKLYQKYPDRKLVIKIITRKNNSVAILFILIFSVIFVTLFKNPDKSFFYAIPLFISILFLPIGKLPSIVNTNCSIIIFIFLFLFSQVINYFRANPVINNFNSSFIFTIFIVGLSLIEYYLGYPGSIYGFEKFIATNIWCNLYTIIYAVIWIFPLLLCILKKCKKSKKTFFDASEILLFLYIILLIYIPFDI